jgi:HlyD family secretion protein
LPGATAFRSRVCGLVAAAGLSICVAYPAWSLDLSAFEVRAKRACFSDRVRVTGYLVPRRETFVTMNLGGFRVSEVLVQEGAHVAADQELIRLTRFGDDPTGGGERVGAPSAISLRAPSAGVVTRITARVGALTGSQSEPLVSLTTDPGIDALVEVPSFLVTKVRLGAAVRVLIGNGIEAKGAVRVPVSEVDPATQFGRARISMQPHSALRAGIFASALIDTEHSCGIGVPRSAIIRQNDTVSVQVLNAGRVETRRVRVGLSSADNVEIREGLAEGESVIANAGVAF